MKRLIKRFSIPVVVFFMTFFMVISGTPTAQGKKIDPQLQRLLLNKVDHTNHKNFHNKLVTTKVNDQKEVLVSVFIKANPKALAKILKSGAQVHTVLSNGLMTADVPIKSLPGLIAMEEVEDLEAGRTMQLYTDASIPTGLGGLNLTRSSDRTANGIIAGAVDSGIDYTHNDFRKSDGTTRILYIWDQSDVTDSKPPTGYTYGREYTSADINNAFSGVPELNQKDTNGHGTHVMGTIAGNHSKYTGVGPEADIIMVKYDFDGGRNSSTYMVDGINYIFSKASELGKPAAINLSMGTDYGPHDGSTVSEMAIDSLVGQGKIVVVAAGNAGRNLDSPNRGLWGDPIHGEGTIVERGSSTINFTIPPYTPDSSSGNNDYLFFDTWYQQGDICQVQITTPSGKKYPPNFLASNKNLWKTGSAGAYYSTPEGTILVFNASPGDPLGSGSDSGDNELYIEISEYAGTPAPATGVWKIQIFDRGGLVSGTYDGWHGTSGTLTSSSFTYEGRNPDSRMTVGNPASATKVITIGAYTTKTCWDYLGGTQPQCYGVSPLYYYDTFTLGDIAYFSSQGPTRDGRMKPEITAPGVGICASLSSMLSVEQVDYYYGHNRVDPDGIHAVLQGTSMACPHGTGSVALLLAINPMLDPAAAKDILTSTASVDTFTGSPNNTWGAGKINLDAALAYEPPNQSPVANAGGDQTAVDEDGDGYEIVTLDGSGSFDPDGSIISYQWNEGETLLGSGVNMSLSFSIGIHLITLTVTDNDVASATDEVVITVNEPLTGPVINSCIPNQGKQGQQLLVYVNGSGFQAGAGANFGAGITVQSVTFIADNQLQVKININRKAALGPRDVIITNPDGNSGTLPGGFSVIPR